MRIAIGSDHAGIEAKKAIIEALREENNEVVDLGTYNDDSVDYSDYAHKVAEAVAGGQCERGILLCGTGIGMAIAANKVNGIRAALCHDEYTVKMSREHNDANILCLGARILPPEKASSLAIQWLEIRFEGGRHQKRVSKVMELEKKP